MKARITGLPNLLWRALQKFYGDDCGSMASSLSFATFFSLPALLAVLVAIASMVADPESVRQALTKQIGGLIGGAGAAQVATIVAHARPPHGSATPGAVLGIVALVLGATGAFIQLQSALNRVWGVKPDPTQNQVKQFFVKRVFSFGVVVATAFFVLVSLALSTLLAAFSGYLSARYNGPVIAVAVEMVSGLVTLAVIAGLFAVMYRYLPDARISWRDVRAGAIGSALFFVIGKTLIGYYLGGSDPGNAYGAAGSLAVVLIWVYYTSMVVLFGAEFTRVWSEKKEGPPHPEEGAVRVVREERPVERG